MAALRVASSRTSKGFGPQAGDQLAHHDFDELVGQGLAKKLLAVQPDARQFRS